jgi:hypothetical protein
VNEAALTNCPAEGPCVRRDRPGEQASALSHRVVPAGPRAERQAGTVRDRLVREVEERGSPRTAATVNQLLDRYLDKFDGTPRTLELYGSYVRKHIGPLIGEVKVAVLDAEILDSFYAELRRCRDHCSGRRGEVQHRTPGKHQCDDWCRPHVCGRWARPRYDTCTSSFPVPTGGRCGGTGSALAQSPRLSRRPHRRRIQSPQALRMRRES